jgi:Fe-S-cluster-containing dehydrogenase component
LLGTLGHPSSVTIEQAASASGVDAATLQRLATTLGQAKPSLVLAGGTGTDALDLAHAVNAINQAVGNVGQTINSAAAVTAFEHAATYADVRDLAARMKSGAVPLLMVRGANPAFSTPPSLGFAAAMEKVPFKVSFSSYPDETAELCDLVLPDHHALESWGEASPVAVTVSLQQPGMDPVFASRQTADVLITLAKGDPSLAAKYPWADYRSWLISRFPGAATGFTNALTTGVAPSGAQPVAAVGSKGSPAAKTPSAKGAPAAAPVANAAAPVPGGPIEQTHGDFYLLVYPSPVLGDGRGANKPWLQELPDPVTKIVWQTVIELHPETARKLGVEAGDHLRVETDTGSIEAPAFVYLGVRPDTVAVALGRGHTAYGRYAHGVGINPLIAVPSVEDRAGSLALTCTKARVTKASDHTLLISTEGSARQHGRGIARAITAVELGTAAASGPVEADARRAAPPPAGAGTEGAGGAGEEEMPGDASHEFLPGLRSPVANDAQGDYGDTTSKSLGMYAADHWSGMAKRRWAMTVDLARCTGCSACVTACYAENNIPTVGAPWQGAQVLPDHTGFGANILRGREMAWIRLERYFEGANHEDGRFDPDFETRFIPMLCQQCGNAPCEPVCPVYATYHSPDGLNVQVYNRCVGTRYCSNNCPYKVRYFNWFGYGESDRIQYAFPEPLNWQLNPDVTVRGKGVMEKCTFCLQRIREAEHRARLEHRELEPDEFTVACAQACPSRAITFGDAADPRWSLTKMVEDRRAYHVFEELNTFTAVVYLKKVTHPAPSAPATT